MRLSNVAKMLRNVAATSAVALLYAPAAAFAQGTGGPDLGLAYATAIGLTTTDIRTTVSRIISYFLGFLGIIAVCIMLYAGFLWMTAGGSEEKVSTAKRWMINGTIGLVIIMSAFAITQFIFRAVEEGAGGGTSGCPAGVTCGGPGGFGGGGGGGFRVQATTPAGPGPSNGGWPKNYGITMSFNSAVADGSVTPSTFVVRKCNARLNGSGDPQPFSNAGCGAAISGTTTVDNNRITFKPNASAEADPTDFDHDFWYKVNVTNAIRDMASRTLLCPIQTVDISATSGNSDYCERAVAFNDLRDVSPPTVVIAAPVSPPAYCASALVDKAQIVATGSDDFLPASIDFLFDGGTNNLIDVNGDPVSNAINGGLVNPFTADSVFVSLPSLSIGVHHVGAVAHDGVPQSSSTADSAFSVVPPHCCNNTQDAGDGETGVDCGGACGSCNGSSCTDGSQCASGYCNPATHQCEERPFIQTVSPLTGGVGTIITITGTGFGNAPGSVVFLGPDAADTDDVTAVACAPEAWTDVEVKVAVPTGALSGALKLVTAPGPSDRTDDGFGPPIGNFNVGGTTSPGICYLAPSTGAPASTFAIHGAGFGATIGGSQAFMGANPMTVTVCGGGETDCGWSDTVVWATVPPIAENTYPVHLDIGGHSTNPSNFLLRNSSSSNAPRVTSVIPESGPVGSYVTIQGSGFGSAKGTVKFKLGADETDPADAEPICADNWHDNYIVVKVPATYHGGLGVIVSAGGVAHKIQVGTAPPPRSSNDDITFKITNEDPRPGICSITPDNGPPGNNVVIVGEGFGPGPGTTTSPMYAALFFKTQAKHCLLHPATACVNVGQICSNPADGVCVLNNVPSDGYSSWNGTQVGTVVAGETLNHCSIAVGVACLDAGLPCSPPTNGVCVADRSGWPATGPVYVVSSNPPFSNRLSSNAIPFRVQDCNDSGIACPVGQSCCSNGSCQASCVPVARNSAYSWRFSTNVLPVLPKVVERAVCSITSHPPVAQSPSPYKDSTDACLNSQLFFEFNRSLDTATFDGNVAVVECGSGPSAVCGSSTVPLNTFGAAGTFGNCESMAPDHCKTFQTRPANTYNGGSHYFIQNTWYRVTLHGSGIKEPDAVGVIGRFLDGDDNGTEGGDYVYTFRVRNTADPCQVTAVYVNPPQADIQQDQTAMNFGADPWYNCNLLQCGPSEPFGIAWSQAAGYLDLSTASPDANCTKPVIGRSETPPGSPTRLTASVTPLNGAPPGGSAIGPPKTGDSDVTVKFADPRVVDTSPKSECVQACINADVVATFNVPMDALTLTSSNVEIRRCRNTTCIAPFETTLAPGVTTSVSAIPTDGTAPPPDGSILHKHVTINILGGDLLPGTFYRVWVHGGPSGVKSRSGVQLAGLNDNDSYSWKFRTRDDPEACAVARTQVIPGRAVMRYVSERKDLNVIPFGSPDECSSVGQQLKASSYNWSWSFEAPNKVLQGFVDGAPPFTWPLIASSTLVDANPAPKRGCTSSCLLMGSQTARPQCGNGVLDSQYEECEQKVCNGGGTPGAVCLTAATCGGGTCVANAGCGTDCRLLGTVASCGNHSVEPLLGEACDMIAGNVCTGGPNDGHFCVTPTDCGSGTCGAGFGFPRGCKKPGEIIEGFGDNVGCVFTGPALGETCGDGFIGDGEACDDGNAANNDGCSSTCLKEGTLRSCLDTTEACIDFCGNGRVEYGEDAACEPNPGAAGCDISKCVRLGTAPGSGAHQCGNGVDDLAFGEDPGCDTDPQRNEFCTDRCLYKGSSPFYTEPSFCGDAVAGKGEKAYCETVTPDLKADAYQVVAAGPQVGFDPAATNNSTSVKATVAGVPDGNAGRSQVTLSCNCKSESESYCGDLLPGLACADNGCCTPRPTVTQWEPKALNSCRNPEITLVFSEVMNPSSISQNLLIGFNNGSGPCSAPGSVQLADEGGRLRPLGFWQRLWKSVLAFVRDRLLHPVFGVVGSPPSEVYCSVPGSIVTITEGPAGGSQHSKTFFYLTRSLPANKFIRIQLNPGVKSAGGVPIAAPWRQYFGTGPTICALEKVRVSPPSILLSSLTQKEVVTASGVAATGQAIVPTLDYKWEWGWDIPVAPSPIVLEPRATNVTQCVLGATCSSPTCPCTIYGATCDVTSGQTACNVTATAKLPQADVRVRGAESSDGFKAVNSSGPEPINARATLVNPNGSGVTISCNLGTPCAGASCPCSVSGVSCTVPNGLSSCDAAATAFVSDTPPDPTGRATVLLCNAQHVWPSYQRCVVSGGSGTITVPWLRPPSNVISGCTVDTWYPFYDPETNVEFYYCRDMGGEAGDVAPTLPCLKEKPAQVLNPGRDILREFLFTFETSPTELSQRCIDGPPATGKWTSDAIGLRVSKNEMHQSAADWYVAKGFRGSPSPMTIDGYGAVKDGRTVYVNAASKNPANQIYTNVNVISFSEGAQAETSVIYSQILGFVNFNRNEDFHNYGICRIGPLRADRALKCNKDEDCRVNGAGQPILGREKYNCNLADGSCRSSQCSAGSNAGRACTGPIDCPGGSCAHTPLPTEGISVACDADVDCQFDAEGRPVPARVGVVKCDAAKSKISRDVRRWSDLQTVRARLIEKKGSGPFPTLQAGTFMRAQTNSRWPSWDGALAGPIGLKLPVDPLNKHGACQVNPSTLALQPAFDKDTCWDDKDRLYRCAADSHVYEYVGVGGVDFKLRNDFEYKNVTNPSLDTWAGKTCLELSASDCIATDGVTHLQIHPECAKTCADTGLTCTTDADCGASTCSGACNYRQGKLFIGGGSAPVNGPPICNGAQAGESGICGDGILSNAERDAGKCEIGMSRPQSCDADLTGASRMGSHTQVCSNVCEWKDAGKCSFNSTNAGTNCTVDDECHGTNPKCVVWAGSGPSPLTQSFKCVGGATNTTCTGPCAGGQQCVSACTGGSCGDGIRQNPPETCDDGPLNGTYGHCNSTCTGFFASCGDGKKQPNESCDCGGLNGLYAFNGILSNAPEPGVNGPACQSDAGAPFPVSAPTCSWDCQAAGPRCGDSVINGTEECDGGFQEFKGYCNDTAQSGCNESSSCPNLGTCLVGPDTAPATADDFCSSDPAKHCVTNEDCVPVCGHFCPTPEQKRRRECSPNDPTKNDSTNPGEDTAACTWATWQCTAPGSCSNGIRETGEECDDGNTNNNDSCVIDPAHSYVCRTARCGDGYTNPSSGEECDDATNNGRPCLPQYGLTCNYCSGACRVITLTGGFCGDSLIQDVSWIPQPPPDKLEQCDGSNGLGVDWICVGKAQQYKSYGKYLGQALCSLSSCKRACLDPDAEPCENLVGDNNDNDSCPTPPQDDAAHSTMHCHSPIALAPMDFLPAANMQCATFNGKKRCTELAFTIPGGGFAGIDFGSIFGLGTSLYDICDPDDDNDGVPDERDCDPNDFLIHPAYSFTWSGGTITIPAALEYCDTKDNDCNNLVDDDWVLTPRPPVGSLNLDGRVVDAFFPDQVPIVGARVIAQRQLCSGDKITQCDDNTACGGTYCDGLTGSCHGTATPCTTDYECGGPNGTCGDLTNPNGKDRIVLTDGTGHFALNNVRVPSSACKVRIQVDRFVPGGDLPPTAGVGGGDELLERAGRGYFAQSLQIPGGASGTIYYDGAAGHQERVLLVPVPRPGTAILAFIWSGSLGSSYMDSYLSIPGNGPDDSCAVTPNDGGSDPDAICPNPLNYTNHEPWGRLTNNPWARLVCSANGGGTNCGSFSTSPELMIFRWGGPSNVAIGQSFKFSINEYNCSHGCNGSFFRSIKSKVVGGYNNGVGPAYDINSVAGGGIGPVDVPASGGDDYWHIMDWRRHDSSIPGEPWAWSLTMCRADYDSLTAGQQAGSCRAWEGSMPGQP